MSQQRPVLGVTDDLMFRSRIEAVLRAAGIPSAFTSGERLTEVAAELLPRLILIDYSRCGEAGLQAIQALKAAAVTAGVPVVAYGSHMDLAGRDKARAAGADEVLANSQIASDLPGIVRRHAGSALQSLTLRLGHSPDPDDAFMFYPLASEKLDTADLRFEQVLKDIETLNRMALDGDIEITAASVHAYGHLSARYAILPCGGSFGDGYGPLLVGRRPSMAGDLRGASIAVPGTLTSAYLALRLFAGEVTTRTVPFDAIPDHVLSGKSDFGLLIHEGQLTYRALGLHPIADLGAWWKEETGLPLPLGVNLVRKDLGAARCRQVARILREAIDFSLAHRDEALTYAMRFGRGLERGLTDRFVGMYVNDLTREAGSSGRKAIALFLEKGHASGLLPQRVVPEFVDYE
ncbi:MAG TPA: MqnA/MqnD/SBP family protein [Candidatus Polarisedimenticolia bacterium]|nr:MqnA/MqnD/SBP family protein [Candidatus Polarisedimenticolia bacterium]